MRRKPVSAKGLVMHGVPTYMSVDVIFWHANELRLVVGEIGFRGGWLVRLDRIRVKSASSLVLYFGGVVPISGRVLRLGGCWCPIDLYEFARRSVPSACARYGP